jgi:hypothetical protein
MMTMLLILILCVAGLFLAKDWAVKTVMEYGVELVTGLPLKIGNLHIQLADTSIAVDDLFLYNPKGFPEKEMVSIPEIFINYDLEKFLNNRIIHFEEIRLDLEKLIIVKNSDGTTNIQSIKALKKDKEPPEKTKPEEGKPAAALPPIHIDLLTYKVGKVMVKDYSKGGEPVVQEYNLDIQERLENIQDFNTLVRVITFKTLTHLPNATLANFNLTDLHKQLNGMLEDVMKQIPGLKGTVDKTLNTTTDILNKTKEGVSDVFNKLPFGNRQ